LSISRVAPSRRQQPDRSFAPAGDARQSLGLPRLQIIDREPRFADASSRDFETGLDRFARGDAPGGLLHRQKQRRRRPALGGGEVDVARGHGETVRLAQSRRQLRL
jgi:hypothetical protein